MGAREKVKRRGFTLVEILVAITIILVLVALAFPVMGAARRRALVTKDSSNMRQVLQACMLYSVDHDDKWPLAKDITTFSRLNAMGGQLLGEPYDTFIEEAPYLGDALRRYVRSEEVMCSPLADPKSPTNLCKSFTTDYRYNDLVAIYWGTFKSSRPVLMGPDPIEISRKTSLNCGWSDGSVKWTTRFACIDAYFDPYPGRNYEDYWDEE